MTRGQTPLTHGIGRCICIVCLSLPVCHGGQVHSFAKGRISETRACHESEGSDPVRPCQFHRGQIPPTLRSCFRTSRESAESDPDSAPSARGTDQTCAMRCELRSVDAAQDLRPLRVLTLYRCIRLKNDLIAIRRPINCRNRLCSCLRHL